MESAQQPPSRFQLSKTRWQALAVQCRLCPKNSADETGYWSVKLQICNLCYRKQYTAIRQIAVSRSVEQTRVTRAISEQRPSGVSPPSYGKIAELTIGELARPKTLVFQGGEWEISMPRTHYRWGKLGLLSDRNDSVNDPISETACGIGVYRVLDGSDRPPFHVHVRLLKYGSLVKTALSSHTSHGCTFESLAFQRDFNEVQVYIVDSRYAGLVEQELADREQAQRELAEEQQQREQQRREQQRREEQMRARQQQQPDDMAVDDMVVDLTSDEADGNPDSNNNKEEDRSGKCVVCWEQDSNIAVVPCGHLAVCESCAHKSGYLTARYRKCCVVCRGPVQSTLKIWHT